MSTYAVNHLCRQTLRDKAFREAMRSDPRAAISGLTLTPAEREAVVDGQVGELYRMGANVFLLGYLVRFGLDELVARKMVIEGTRVELARAPAGLAMKKGVSKPDISTPDRLRETLLSASSVGYSISASGQYVSHELFKKLGIEEQMKGKAREVKGLTPVSETVANGENQYGFQAVSEILPIEGAELIGKLPDAVEFITPVSAAVAFHSKNPDGARSLLRFLTRQEMGSVLKRHGLDLPSK